MNTRNLEGMMLWPTWQAEKARLASALDLHSRTVRPMPGIATAAARDTLALQFVASLRRERYYQLVQRQRVAAPRADPNHASFDPERAIAFHVQQRNVDEAAWLAFLMTAFGRPAGSGWRRLKDVYGKLGNGVWDWHSTSANPGAFRLWLDANHGLIGGKFGNHRKYESLRSNAVRGIGHVVEDYVGKVTQQGGHQRMFAEFIRQAGNDPHAIFEFFYRNFDVLSFGRLGMFDFLSLLGRYRIVPMDAGSAYLVGATGPRNGARLLFNGNVAGNTPAAILQKYLSELDDSLDITMKVMEDAICNWQKSPTIFVHYVG